MRHGFRHRTPAVALATIMIAGFASAAMAVDPGVGVGKPGVGIVDPGLNQPGVVGNVGGVARRSVRR